MRDNFETKNLNKILAAAPNTLIEEKVASSTGIEKLDLVV